MLAFYGQALVLKVSLVLEVGAIGLINAALLHPRVAAALGRLLRRPAGWTPVAPDRPGRTLLVEAVGATLILLVAATLGVSQPGRGPAFDPPAEAAASPSLSSQADDLLIVVAVEPNRPGQNFVTLGVYNTRRPAPAPIDAVDVRLAPPGGGEGVARRAEALGGGRYQVAGSMIGVPGDWRLVVIAHRRGLPDATSNLSWTVLPASAPGGDRRPVLSRQPLAPLLDVAAIVVALLAAAAALWLWWSRRGGAAAMGAAPERAPLAEGGGH